MFNKSNNSPDTPKGASVQSQAPFESESPAKFPPQEPSSFRPSSGSETISSSKPSIISEDVVLTGNIKTHGALQIEGTVIGNLEVASLTIGPTGVFEGDVRCKSMNIRGRFKGTSVCRELMVSTSAQVDANITYQELTLQRGAGLRGELYVANFE